MSGRRYLLISPCRDEAQYLSRTLESVAAQSQRPTRWILVDDGSGDETPDLLQAFARSHDWATVISLPRRETRILGSGVIRAFNAGLATVDLHDFDYVCKLDMDLDLPTGYFADLMDRMEADPRLASASGTPYVVDEHGTRDELGSFEISWGMSKFYRTAAFQQIGGFVPELMWDGIDCHTSRMLGWRARTFADHELRFQHLRPEGSSDRNILRGRRRHGHGQYFMGTHPLFLIASAVRRAADRPRLLGTLHILAGYVAAATRRVPRHGTPEFRRQLRRFQIDALLFGKNAATYRWEATRARAWRGGRAPDKVAYLVSRYPTMSHTFIAGEIEGLRKQGWVVTVFSARRGEPRPHPQESVTALTATPLKDVIRALAMLARDAPLGAARVFGDAMRPVSGPRPRWVGAAYAVEAAVLLAELDRVDVRHVHVHFANNGAEIARLACALDRTRHHDARGLTWSLTIHGLWMHGMGDTSECFPARDEHRYGALRDKLRSASAVAVVDEFARHALAGLDAGGPTPQVIRMGVDPSVFMPNLQSNQGDRPFTVLTVGRLAPEKDLGTVLRAFATANPGNWRLRVVGDGPFRSRLHQEALALGLGSSVEFLGHRAPCELPRLYNSSDVVAMSSRSEGIPTVLMEAMACGVPVVATRVGGIPELVIEGTGTLVQVGDVAALAAALSALAGDAAAARRSGARARQHILAHYDVGGRAATWSRFLRQAMSEQAPRLGEPAQKTADREHH